MATTGHKGSALTFTWDSTTVAGLKTRGLTINNQHADITSDDDSGWRTFLADPVVQSISITLSGIADSEDVLADAMAASVTGKTIVATLPSSLTTPGNLNGTFHVTSFEISGNHDGAAEYSGTFESTGAVTYSASA